MDEQALLVEGGWTDDPPFSNRALQARGWPRGLPSGPIAGRFGRSRQPGEKGIFLTTNPIAQQLAQMGLKGRGQGAGSHLKNLAGPGGDTGFPQVARQRLISGQELEGPHEERGLQALNRVLAEGLARIEEAAAALDHQNQSASIAALADRFSLGHGPGDGAQGWGLG